MPRPSEDRSPVNGAMTPIFAVLVVSPVLPGVSSVRLPQADMAIVAASRVAPAMTSLCFRTCFLL
jgi:hypothetical protein